MHLSVGWGGSQTNDRRPSGWSQSLSHVQTRERLLNPVLSEDGFALKDRLVGLMRTARGWG